MKNNLKDNTDELILEIRKKNPKLANSLKNFRAVLGRCSEDAPEFQTLLKLFPNQTFSKVCKRWVKNMKHNSKLL